MKYLCKRIAATVSASDRRADREGPGRPKRRSRRKQIGIRYSSRTGRCSIGDPTRSPLSPICKTWAPDLAAAPSIVRGDAAQSSLANSVLPVASAGRQHATACTLDWRLPTNAAVKASKKIRRHQQRGQGPVAENDGQALRGRVAACGAIAILPVIKPSSASCCLLPGRRRLNSMVGGRRRWRHEHARGDDRQAGQEGIAHKLINQRRFGALTNFAGRGSGAARLATPRASAPAH